MNLGIPESLKISIFKKRVLCKYFSMHGNDLRKKMQENAPWLKINIYQTLQPLLAEVPARVKP